MYSTEVNGEITEFGTSGWLYQSNKLMFDRATNTLWHQFLGEPVIGELVGSGITLDIIPNTLTTWSNWVADHPDTTVLDVETGVYPIRAYLPEEDNASAYSSYRSSDETMFPVPQRSTELPTKSRVFGLTFNGQTRAYPQQVLEALPVINDSLGGGNLVIITPSGGGSRAFQRDDREFVNLVTGEGGSSPVSIVDDQGLSWNMEEDALVSASDPSVRLPRLPGRSSFWFGWYAFYPGTEIFSPGS